MAHNDSQRAMDDIAKVAEAMWRADPFRMGDPDVFTGTGDQGDYRMMAIAAIDALLGEELTAGSGHVPPPCECAPVDLLARLRAFGRDCVEHGDMTPSAEQMLHSILDLT